MESVALEQFNKFKLSTIPMAKFHHCLSYESDKDTRTTTTNF